MKIVTHASNLHKMNFPNFPEAETPNHCVENQFSFATHLKNPNQLDPFKIHTGNDLMEPNWPESFFRAVPISRTEKSNNENPKAESYTKMWYLACQVLHFPHSHYPENKSSSTSWHYFPIPTHGTPFPSGESNSIAQCHVKFI